MDELWNKVISQIPDAHVLVISRYREGIMFTGDYTASVQVVGTDGGYGQAKTLEAAVDMAIADHIKRRD